MLQTSKRMLAFSNIVNITVYYCSGVGNMIKVFEFLETFSILLIVICKPIKNGFSHTVTITIDTDVMWWVLIHSVMYRLMYTFL